MDCSEKYERSRPRIDFDEVCSILRERARFLCDEILKNAIPPFFAILQSFTVILISGAFKMYADIRKQRRDLRAAFTKIRELEAWKKEIELRDTLLNRAVESSKACNRASERQT